MYGKSIKGKGIVEKTEEDSNIKPKEKRTIKESLALHFAKASGATFAAAIGAPILTVLREGIYELFNPLCILTVLLGLGLSFLCKWCSKKLLHEV